NSDRRSTYQYRQRRGQAHARCQPGTCLTAALSRAPRLRQARGRAAENGRVIRPQIYCDSSFYWLGRTLIRSAVIVGPTSARLNAIVDLAATSSSQPSSQGRKLRP